MTARKARDTAGGSIQYGYNGRRDAHRIRYWGKDPESGVYRRMSEVVHGTRRDAQKRRAELVVAHGDDAPVPTIGQLWELYALPTWERLVADGRYAEGSLKRRKSGWNAHVSKRWADVPCDKVTPLEVQQWVDTLPRTAAENSLSVLKWIYSFASKGRYVDHDPMAERYVLPPKSTVKSHSSGIWTVPEMLALWDHLRGTYLEAAAMLSMFGSCRTGESLAVTSDRVSELCHEGVTCAVVRVDRRVKQTGREMAERLKTDRSVRSVVLPGAPGERLLKLASERDGLLTDDGTGRPILMQTYERKVMEAMGDAGLPVYTPRNMRNSWETAMRHELRLDPYVIEVLMGHAVPTTTGRYYDKPSPEQLAKQVCEAYAARPIFER